MKIRQAFTLVEVLVAVAILTLVITGASIVESSNIRIGTSSKYNIQASGLAQAGTNLVKAVSDKVHLGVSATVIAGECTDPTNLAKCPAGVYYLNSSNNKLLICSIVNNANPLMPICNIDGAILTVDGMQFRRTVIISSTPIVRVIVSWLEKGQVRTLESKVYLGSTAPTVTFYASPTTVVSGASSTLTWSSTNATSCTATGNWSWSGATTSGSQSTGALTSSKTYTLTCSGSGGTSLPAVAAVVVTGSTPTVSLTAAPVSVVSGGSSTLTWSSTNATSCTATGNWSWSGATTSGSQSTGALTSSKTYTLTCSGSGGTSLPASATVTVTGVLSCNGTTIYDSANFIGVSAALPLGDYKVSLNHATTCGATGVIANSSDVNMGLCNDSISSIKVGAGCYVFAYTDDNFNLSLMVPYLTFTGKNYISDASSLGTMDNTISSLRVVDASLYPVSVYVDTNYGGNNAYLLPGGVYDILSLPHVYGIFSNTISSVKVAAGHSVKLYADSPHTTGATITLTADTPSLGAFENLTQSLQVQ